MGQPVMSPLVHEVAPSAADIVWVAIGHSWPVVYHDERAGLSCGRPSTARIPTVRAAVEAAGATPCLRCRQRRRKQAGEA